MNNGTKIAFIGPGVMAEAMIAGLVNQEVVAPESIVVSGPSVARVDELSERYSVRSVTDNAMAVEDSDVVVLAVKPQRLDHVLADLRGSVKSTALVVSIISSVRVINSAVSGGWLAPCHPNRSARGARE